MTVVLEVYQLATLRFEQTRVDNRSFAVSVSIRLTLIRLQSDKEVQERWFAIQSTIVTMLIVVQSVVFVSLTTRMAAKAYEEVGVINFLR